MQIDSLEILNEKLETASPYQILEWAAGIYQDKLALVTSFQPTGIVTLHMLAEIAPRTPVLTLDTGLLFPETYALIDDLEQRLNLNLIRVQPAQTVDEQAAAHGAALWERDPNLCCYLRKVAPLKQALEGYSAWITGLRRDQSERRAHTPIISWDKKHDLVKLCPFASWTEADIWNYMWEHDLPYNELHDRDYPSIGCVPCTHPVPPGTDDLRAGRWKGRDKTECGIHVGML